MHNGKRRLLNEIYRPIFIFGFLLLLIFALQPANASPYFDPDFPLPEEELNIQVDERLLAQFAEAESVGYMIFFRDTPDLAPAYTLDWEARGRFVYETLSKTAVQSQARVRSLLDGQKIPYEAFWIENVIVVEGSSISVMNNLMSFQEIASIQAKPVLRLIEPTERSASVRSPLVVEPNLTQIQVPAVWGMGYDGTGMVVGNIDSGVRYTHETLEPQYRGNLGGAVFDHNYNWWDPYGDHPLVPADDHGHGSHTMGTMIGDDGGINQIGVAPDATWIACRGCNTSSCGGTQLLACAQFMAAPWDLNGANPNPDLRPQVVNNSWGDCDQTYDGWYQGVVDSWHAAGIYPVFSNGNASNCSYSSPPGLNTVGNPARYGNVTGVGSTGQNNGQYATHSNWGPTDNLDTVNPLGDAALKPQVVAPGVNIRSSVASSDSAYGSWAGTSMSAPHVSGLIALMWEAAPCLRGDYATTENIIESTATPINYDDGTGGGAHTPNYATGWGEINALAAVEEAILQCGPFLLEPTPTTLDVCSPGDAVYTIAVTQNQAGYTDPVTMSTVGEPAGSTVGFSVNPVTPPGGSVLTLSNTGSAASGSYAIDVVGVGPTATYTTTVDLNLFGGVPGAPTLTSPTDGATDVSFQPTFSWTSVAEADTYHLELATDAGFTNLVYTATATTPSHGMSSNLNLGTMYFWRVRAMNECGLGAASAVYDFTTLLPVDVLLVDDDDNSPDVRSYYTNALDNLGLSYQVWDTGNSDTEPDMEYLSVFPQVVWFTGDEFGGAAGPGGVGEAALGSWLDAGGCLLVSSQEYLFDRGITGFMSSYLGVASATNDIGQSTVTGSGSVFGGLGPYSLSYPFINYSDVVSPDGTAELAFSGNAGDAGVNKETVNYKTSFWGFPLEALPDAATRETVLQTFVNWCREAEPGVTVAPVNSVLSGSIGETITHTFTVTNTGEVTDTYQVSLAGYTWNTTALTNTGSILPGESTGLTVTVDIPSNPGPTEVILATDTFTLTVTSDMDPGTFANALGTTNANVHPGVVLTGTLQGSGQPGETIPYSLVLTNTGDYTDTFQISVIGLWTATANITETIGLGAGISQDFMISVTVPSVPVIPAWESTTVTVESGLDDTVSDSLVITSIQYAPRVFLPFIHRE